MTKHGFKSLTGTVWIIDRRMYDIEERQRRLNDLFYEMQEEHDDDEGYYYEWKPLDKDKITNAIKQLEDLVQQFKDIILEVKAS